MVRFNPSGFTTEDIIIEYIKKVIIPYQEHINKEICLIFDKAPSHRSATYLLQPLDVVINKPIKDQARKTYIDWLGNAAAKHSSGIIPPPTPEDLLDWCTSAMETIEPTLVTRSFEVTGSSCSVGTLQDKQLLSAKLSSIVEKYLTMVETTVDDDMDPYSDPADKQLYQIAIGQELILASEKV